MFTLDLRPVNKYFNTTLPRGLEKSIKIGFADAVEWLTNYSRVKHPTFKNRTNRLAKSLTYRVRKTNAVISSDVFYAPYLYYGTKDHLIPKSGKMPNGKYLSWVQNGQRRFSKGHMVSGIKKSVWIRRNYEEKEVRFNEHIYKQIRREFQ